VQSDFLKSSPGIFTFESGIKSDAWHLSAASLTWTRLTAEVMSDYRSHKMNA